MTRYLTARWTLNHVRSALSNRLQSSSCATNSQKQALILETSIRLQWGKRFVADLSDPFLDGGFGYRS